MTKGTLTKTRTGRPRTYVDPVAVAAELEKLKATVAGHERVLSPAFAPAAAAPIKETMTDIRGPGAYPREPVVMRQASSNSGDIWAGDAEHSPSFMQAIKDGVPLAELRKRSADDAIMRANASNPNPVMWRTRDNQPVMDGSVVQPPEQHSVVHHEWSDFPDHAPAPPPTGREPDFVTARQHAPQMPGREPPTVVRGL